MVDVASDSSTKVEDGEWPFVERSTSSSFGRGETTDKCCIDFDKSREVAVAMIAFCCMSIGLVKDV